MRIPTEQDREQGHSLKSDLVLHETGHCGYPVQMLKLKDYAKIRSLHGMGYSMRVANNIGIGCDDFPIHGVERLHDACLGQLALDLPAKRICVADSQRRRQSL